VDVSSAAALSSVERLTVSARARGLERLAALPRLTKLVIAGRGDSFDLDRLRGFHGLRELDLRGVRSSHLAALAGLAKLETLVVTCEASESAAPLAGLAELRELTLSGAAVPDLEVLRAAPKLEELWLGAAYGAPAPSGRAWMFGVSLPNLAVHHLVEERAPLPRCPLGRTGCVDLRY
jgi:hypothetical protein